MDFGPITLFRHRKDRHDGATLNEDLAADLVDHPLDFRRDGLDERQAVVVGIRTVISPRSRAEEEELFETAIQTLGEITDGLPQDRVATGVARELLAGTRSDIVR